jgi:hypothetical protein
MTAVMDPFTGPERGLEFSCMEGPGECIRRSARASHFKGFWTVNCTERKQRGIYRLADRTGCHEIDLVPFDPPPVIQENVSTH